MRILTIPAMLLGIAFAALPSYSPASEAPRKEQVDLLLVLAADVSRSVDSEKFQLQRDGYTAALVDPRVLRAISKGPLGRIAVTYVEWSGHLRQKILVDWAIIDGLDSAQHFAEQLAETPRPFAGMTAIGTAIEFSRQLLYDAPFSAERMTIDISGDGINNEGLPPHRARDNAVRDNVVINGLPILTAMPMPWNPEHTNPTGGLEAYYRNNVAGGPGSFVMVAEDHKSFGAAIARKMIAEIAAR